MGTNAAGSGAALGQTQFLGPVYDRDPVGHTQLSEEFAQMMPHAVHGEPENGGNLLVTPIVGKV